jgi:hypothetical protein
VAIVSHLTIQTEVASGQSAIRQDTAAQVKALRKAGCKRIFEEKASPVAAGTGRNFTASALKHRLLVG